MNDKAIKIYTREPSYKECYVEMDDVTDAMYVVDQLKAELNGWA